MRMPYSKDAIKAIAVLNEENIATMIPFSSLMWLKKFFMILAHFELLLSVYF